MNALIYMYGSWSWAEPATLTRSPLRRTFRLYVRLGRRWRAVAELANYVLTAILMRPPASAHALPATGEPPGLAPSAYCAALACRVGDHPAQTFPVALIDAWPHVAEPAATRYEVNEQARTEVRSFAQEAESFFAKAVSSQILLSATASPHITSLLIN